MKRYLLPVAAGDVLTVVMQLLCRGNAVGIDGVRAITQDVAQLAVLLHQTLQLTHALVLLLQHHLQSGANLLLQLQHAQAIVLLINKTNNHRW